MSTLNGRNLNKNADAETAGNFQLQGEQYPLLPTLFAIVNAWVRSCSSAGDAESYFVNQKAVLAKCIPGFSTDPGYSQESFYRLLSAVRLKELLYYVTAYGADLRRLSLSILTTRLVSRLNCSPAAFCCRLSADSLPYCRGAQKIICRSGL